ncbi:MAG: DUF2892 domain-containing protein [Deltaproteobacteria bacterium]|nr:DUF2892 domain-containing protein [Deltaproteobacteria bacterium]MBW2658637.1 DUF2892 domain-containing protein [Deltaproteobacteria bacterium]
MKKNIGSMERVLRIVIGAGIFSLAFWGPQSSWAFLGAVPLATGIIGWCPPYALLGISTRSKCEGTDGSKDCCAINNK